MAKSKVFYRIKNINTGKYYTGKMVYITNSKFDEKQFKGYSWDASQNYPISELNKYPKVYERFVTPNGGKVVYREFSNYNKTLDVSESDLPPWVRCKGTYWADEGKFFDTKKGAELVLSQLTKTTKKLRNNKVEFLLNAPPKAADFKIIPCKFKIIELNSDT